MKYKQKDGIILKGFSQIDLDKLNHNIKNQTKVFGSIGAIVLTIAIQAAINIGVVTVVLPTKGIPLPFVSAGGTSMLLSAVAVGVLLNIAKQTAKAEFKE